MNMRDLVDTTYGLQQDEWSLDKPTFGDEGQLEVIGWSGKNGGTKYYILKCNKCSQDVELFGDGVFRSLRGNLVKGALPCGCSGNVKWSKEQFHILCSRKAKELGYKFLGFTGGWRGHATKIKMFCEKHGEWGSGSISNLTSQGCGCPGCMAETSREANIKPDNIMITSFQDSGAFHLDTKFWRSDRLDSKGYKRYWFMSCGGCGETGESFVGSLQKGCLPCACSKHRQQECYINWIVDGDTEVAIKFGIANNSKQRVKQQNLKSTYEILQYQMYKFPDVASCKKAERECKKELECGVVLKRDMPDGYSETTWIYNLSKVQDIYKKFGGILQITLDTDQMTT